MSRATPDVPAPLRAVIPTLIDGPATMLVSGGIGTGKSTALAGIRDALRDAGRTVLSAPPRDGVSAPTALVIDDAHLLSDSALAHLVDVAGEPDTTVVVAAEPRDHRPGLRALAGALERRVALVPLSARETARLLEDATGQPPDSTDLDEAMIVTAGIPFLVTALLSGRPPTAGQMSQKALFALIDRLRRLDEAQLEALMVCTLSTELGATDIAAALDLPAEQARLVIDQARGTGLAEASHDERFRQSVHRAAAQIVGAARHHDVESALLRTQLAFSTLTPQLTLSLAEHGMRDERLAEPLRAHAAGEHSPAVRARIYRAAVDAGATDLRVDLAEALALSGDCSGAAAMADVLLASADPAQRSVGVRVAAAVAAHDGASSQSAQLFAWLGPVPDVTVDAAAVAAHLGTGALAAARSAAGLAHAGPPTVAARASQSLIDGLLGTVEGSYSEAAGHLSQAVTGDFRVPAMTDSPAALVTLAALHSGDTIRAHSVISRAAGSGDVISRAAGSGDREPMFSRRHHLIQAWMRMQEGQLAAAGAAVDEVDEESLHHRDALWATALRTAIARRGADPGALHRHWYAALDILAEYTVDLYSLLPLGELWIAATRLGQPDRLRPSVDRAFAILDALGNPPGWSLPLHWAGVHAGIVANQPAAVTPHAQVLANAASRSPFAAALACAGRSWLRILAGQVDADEVAAAASGLAGFGLISDATRLAGNAAIQARDPRISALMLHVARDLRLASGDDAADEPTPATPTLSRATTLSDREREVAELLVLGMPYRDIGAQLFISAKTVEHHVARIRRRLGADSRSEMLSMLRTIVGTESRRHPA